MLFSTTTSARCLEKSEAVKTSNLLRLPRPLPGNTCIAPGALAVDIAARSPLGVHGQRGGINEASHNKATESKLSIFDSLDVNKMSDSCQR